MGLLCGGHLGCRHLDGRRLGLRSPELWRLLGMGSGGELVARPMDGPGGGRALVAHQPKPQKAHGPLLDRLPERVGVPARALLHVLDEEWRPWRHVGAQLCGQWHLAAAPRLPAFLRRPRSLDVARGQCVSENLRRLGVGHPWFGGRRTTRTRLPRLFRGHGSGRDSGLPQRVQKRRRGRRLVVARILDVRGLTAVGAWGCSHHLANKRARLQPFPGALLPLVVLGRRRDRMVRSRGLGAARLGTGHRFGPHLPLGSSATRRAHLLAHRLGPMAQIQEQRHPRGGRQIGACHTWGHRLDGGAARAVRLREP